MFKVCEYRELLRCKTGNTLINQRFIMMKLAKVTVLLILLICPGPMRAENVNGIGMRLFEFTSEFYMPMGRGSFNGLMASDGSGYRIAIYWMEPAVYHDNTFFLGYSDFIFGKDVVHYWINGVSQPGSFDLSVKDSDPLLPRDVSLESVARSALAIAGRIMPKSHNVDTPLEVGKFFRQSRDKTEYSYEVPSKQTNNDNASGDHLSDEQILNDLPFGRKYSKQMQSDGALVWQAQRVLDGPHVARVTVKPVEDMKIDDADNMFDTKTLGQWTAIPKPYRAYWSFERDYSKLKDLPDSDVAGRELNDKIESYLINNKVPNNICLFFNQLRFKTVILTADIGLVSHSAQTVVERLCEEDSVGNYQGLLELARIAEQIREKYPKQAEEVVRPLVGQMVKHLGPDVSNSIDKLMTTIQRNKWFWYWKVLVEEARRQGLVEEDVAEKLSARLEAARLARELSSFDPFKAIPSVKRYLAQIDANPPTGTITMDDIREILEKGLEKPCADANLDSTDQLVADTVRSIRLIVGEGPFRGERDKLIESIRKFSGLYLVVFRYKEPIDMVLATFLALSFCDTSTSEDHDVLFSQISEVSTEFQAITNKMLNDRGLGVLVEPNDVEKVFSMYKRIFHRNIDNPLWPAFKFPLTDNEKTRLRNKLKQRFGQLEPVLDDATIKVKHGGVSDELKNKTIYNISLAAQQLLPQCAFLRRPSYPGVSCRYRGKYGFAAVIKGQFYIEGERPKEKFRAMKYFHMGHRLEDIVKRERELAGFK
ncbi:MAG: hypothetical protein RQ760_14200 [Sedimentisphaerales bacterium]|nr:hypothetical protein [Sedimentisphaerales bacterium]